MQVLIRARVLVCLDPQGLDRLLFITASWTREYALEYAKSLGLVPQFIVNVKDKRYA
jgi:hypothetical protein